MDEAGEAWAWGPAAGAGGYDGGGVLADSGCSRV